MKKKATPKANDRLTRKAKWTEFHDMHSGGGQKEEWGRIYIEAPEDEARAIFYNRFGHNADRVTCTCCGNDYSVSEHDSLREATAYERGCAFVYRNADGDVVDQSEAWKCGKGLLPGYTSGYEEVADADGLSFRRKHIPLDEFVNNGGGDGKSLFAPKCLFIFAEDILPGERKADIPEQGYVWKD